MGMLVLTRKVTEQIVIGGNITITINDISGGRVKVGVDAPQEIRVWRGELTPHDMSVADSSPDSSPELNFGSAPQIAVTFKSQVQISPARVPGAKAKVKGPLSLVRHPDYEERAA